MEDPFLAEARNHQTEADRNGRVAFQASLAAIVSFCIYGWHMSDDGWWCAFWWSSVIFGVRMLNALAERWFHRNAVRLALSFYEYSKRLND